MGSDEDFTNLNQCNVENATTNLWNKFGNEWRNALDSKPKLRTYKLYKHDLVLEKYISMNLSRVERSVTAQFRFGILPLRLETGRFRGEDIENRLCIFL